MSSRRAVRCPGRIATGASSGPELCATQERDSPAAWCRVAQHPGDAGDFDRPMENS